MTVRLHYAGQIFDLAAEYSSHDVTNSLVRRSNHVFRSNAKLDRRQDPLIEGDTHEFQPWAVFQLATGGEINVWVHDGMQIAVEDTEQISAPLSEDEIAPDPFF